MPYNACDLKIKSKNEKKGAAAYFFLLQYLWKQISELLWDGFVPVDLPPHDVPRPRLEHVRVVHRFDLAAGQGRAGQGRARQAGRQAAGRQAEEAGRAGRQKHWCECVWVGGNVGLFFFLFLSLCWG